MKKIAIILLAVMLAASLGGCGAKSVQEQWISMDTVIAFRAEGKQAEEAVKAAQQEVLTLEALLSRTRETSEVTALNRAGGAAVAVSEPVRQLLTASEAYRKITHGTFDITVAPVCDAWGFTAEVHQVPEEETLQELLQLVNSGAITVDDAGASLGEGQQIDLGGIAKGYVSDLMQALCVEYEIVRGTVSLGGNVYVRGTKEDGSLWRVGIQDPKRPESGGLVGMVGLQDAFAVTSGGYQRYFEENGQRYHHIIDPATGYPADSGLTSVTVVAPANSNAAGRTAGNGTMCDAFSTALFVMGEEKALEFWRSSDLDFDLILVTEDDRVVVTAGIAEQFEPACEEDYTYETVS